MKNKQKSLINLHINDNSYKYRRFIIPLK